MSTEASARLSLWDGVSVVVGIVVGVSLFKVPASVFGNVDGPWAGLGVWALGGLLSFVGALCYAELTAAWPESGGDYVYLSRAYGSCLGFLFGWAQLVAILTGSIGAMAYVFADYAVALFGVGDSTAIAAVAVVGVTACNLFGLTWGRRVQNALTLSKLVGLAGVLGVGALAMARGGAPAHASAPAPAHGGDLGFALVLVLYAYGGWSNAAFVASEVRDPHRNVPRVLLLGTGAVAALYLLVNAAYLGALGFDGLRAASAPAADVLAHGLGQAAGHGMSVLVMISALGAIQGMVFTGARVYARTGRDHPAFRSLSRWSPRAGVPARALCAQAAASLLWIGAVGTPRGRDGLDSALAAAGLPGMPWQRFGGGFDTLVAGTAPAFWLFMIATGAALFALRRREPAAPRPFRVPGYPLTPLVFCASSLFMLEAALRYAGSLAWVGLLPLALGVPLYLATRSRVTDRRRESPRPDASPADR
ncbi:MAG TPA: amino acid permease [Myxococcota bacterium]|nr:amino acid permease [Myxococcota bacterium]